MSDNLLAKIQQKRNRPTFERQDPLLPAVETLVDTISKATDNTEVAEQLEIVPTPSKKVDSSDQLEITIAQLKERLETYHKTRRRSGIILDEVIDDELAAFCQANKITVETFLEAAWIIFSSKEDLKKKVIKESKLRYNKRKEIGALKRQITQLENLQRSIND